MKQQIAMALLNNVDRQIEVPNIVHDKSQWGRVHFIDYWLISGFAVVDGA